MGANHQIWRIAIYALWTMFVLTQIPKSGFADAFATSGPLPITQEELDEIKKTAQTVRIDGVDHYLVGDLLISDEQVQIKAFQGDRWSGGTILFEFDDVVANQPNWQQAFRQACANWADVVSNVRCLQRLPNERNFVQVRTHVQPRCTSFSQHLGMKGGMQVLSIYHDPNFDPFNPIGDCRIASHWDSIDVITHEIGHVFGQVHEQVRWDRDEFVTFLPNNLIDPTDENQLYQFRKVPGTKATSYTPYDFVSIMHYGPNFYARPGRNTLEYSDCYYGAAGRIGSQGIITRNDALGLQHHYGIPIFDMLRERRDETCGMASVNRSERRHYCDQLGENCGPGARRELYRGVTRPHSTWWCPGSFAARCPGASGPHRSCCPVAGRVPLDVQHWRGRRNCSAHTRRRHNCTWACGCPYFNVFARCRAAAFGFEPEVINEYLASEDPQLRTLGRFAAVLSTMQREAKLTPDALLGFEQELLNDFGLPSYFQALNDVRRKLMVMSTGGRTSPQKPLSGSELRSLVADAKDRRRICYLKQRDYDMSAKCDDPPN